MGPAPIPTVRAAGLEYLLAFAVYWTKAPDWRDQCIAVFALACVELSSLPDSVSLS